MTREQQSLLLQKEMTKLQNQLKIEGGMKPNSETHPMLEIPEAEVMALWQELKLCQREKAWLLQKTDQLGSEVYQPAGEKNSAEVGLEVQDH